MTKSYLYVIGPKEGPYKLGFSVNPKKRTKQLQTGMNLDIEVFYMKEVEKTIVKFLEKLLHKEIKRYRIRGEWYNLTLEEAIAEVDFIVIRYESYGEDLEHIVKRGY